MFRSHEFTGVFAKELRTSGGTGVTVQKGIAVYDVRNLAYLDAEQCAKKDDNFFVSGK